MQNSLKDISPRWDRLVEDAANTGLRKENCSFVYRDCNLQRIDDTSTIDDEEEEEEPA